METNRWFSQRPRSGPQSISWQRSHISFENEDFPGIRIVFRDSSMLFFVNSKLYYCIRFYPCSQSLDEKRTLVQQHEDLAACILFLSHHLSENNETQCAFCHEEPLSIQRLATHFREVHWEEVKSPLVKSASKQ